MYSFAERSDVVEVYDEPLYAHYLSRNPDVYRPYRDKLLSVQDNNGDAVMKKLSSHEGGRMDKPTCQLKYPYHTPYPIPYTPYPIPYTLYPILHSHNLTPDRFVKHIAKFTEGVDITPSFGPNNIHFIVVRDPLDMIRSWTKKEEVHKEVCSLDTMGLPILCKLYSDIRKYTGMDPIVVDSNVLGEYPEQTLISLSARLGIPFCKEQLSWKAGPKACDGLWASHWYAVVHQSTGFSTFTDTDIDTDTPDVAVQDTDTQPIKKRKGLSAGIDKALSPDEVSLYREALPFYDLLRRKAVLMDPLCPATSTPEVTMALSMAMSLGSSSSSSTTSVETTVTDHGMQMSVNRLGDPRNETILAWVGDRLLPRDMAKVPYGYVHTTV